MIQPVELQAVIQRSQDVTQIKQHQDAKPQDEHNAIVLNQQKNEMIQHEQVVEKENADKSNEQYDAKEEGKGTYYQQKNKKKKKEEEDGVVIKKDTSFFDVKI